MLPSALDAYQRLIEDVRACHACARMAHAHVLSQANGPLHARVLFVAEAVGRRGGAVTGVPLTRDETGCRFARFLAIAGIDRSACFITNAVLCNPLDARGRNRTPAPAEAARCRLHLARTLEVVQAPLVVALGRVALESLRAIAPHDARIREPGMPLPWAGAPRTGRTIVAMYHPSRQSTLHRPQPLQDQDWRRLGAIYRGLCDTRSRAMRCAPAS